MKKRILCIVLVVLMLVSLLPTMAFAESISECTFEQKVNAPISGEILKMKLAVKTVGEFSFVQSGKDWNIKNSDDKYLNAVDGELSLGSTADTAWTYKNGAFSTSVKTTQRSAGWRFLFWYIPGHVKTVTTTYYLSSVKNGAKLSTGFVGANLYQTVAGTHSYKYVDCKNGTHDQICKNCGDKTNQAHDFDSETHYCICGAYDPAKADVKISVSVSEKKIGFFWNRYTTYTATIKTETTGVKVSKVEYSANNGKTWCKGTAYTSVCPITKLLVKVTDSNGTVHNYEYGAPTTDTYTVTFESNGGSTVESQQIKSGECVVKPTTPTYDGYAFGGWYSDSELKVEYDFATPITKNITLYAKWESSPAEEYFTVTFDSNGGSVVESQQVKAGECAVEPSEPTKDGYVFDGWYSDSALENAYSFDTLIKKDSTIYAKWGLSFGDADDVTDEMDTEVTIDDTYYLSASEQDVLAESSTPVKFYVNSTLTVPYFELYCGGASTGIYLYDDGDYSTHNDDIPNDGCYSGSYVINSNEEKHYLFTAKATVNATNIETNAVDVFAYYEFTNIQLNNMEAISNNIVDLLSSATDNLPENATNDEKTSAKVSAVQGYLNSLDEDGVIEELCYDAEEESFSYVHSSSGVTNVVLCAGEIVNDVAENSLPNTIGESSVEQTNVLKSELSPIEIDYISYKEKAIILYYSDEEHGQENITLGVSSAKNLLQNAGFDVTVVQNCTVDNFKNLQNYDYIYVACHGSTHSYWTSPFTKDTEPVICTDQVVTEETQQSYASDLKADRIIVAITEQGKKYWICPNFIKNCYSSNKLKSNIVRLACCKGGINNYLADSFVEAGAGAVTAYTDTVWDLYELRMMEDTLSELFKGKSISEAVEFAKIKNGYDDDIWAREHYIPEYEEEYGVCPNIEVYVDPAECKIFGGSSTKIHHSLTNGNFDSVLNIATSNVLSWNQYGDARCIFKQSGILPKSNPKMAIISSGFGSKNNETTSVLYQTILVPENAKSIAFSYDVISEEPMEWVGTQYDDVFIADILSTDGELLEALTYESVNTSTWYAVDGINFPGGDDTTYHTRWKTVTSDVISKYCNQLVVLRFVVQDSGDAIYDTAVLIDSVEIE